MDELLCDLVDPKYEVLTAEVIRYLSDVYPADVYILRYFDSDKFINAFLRSSVAKNAAFLWLQGVPIRNGEFHYAKGTCDRAILDYYFDETKKAPRTAEIGEIRGGVRLVQRLIEKYQSCHDVRYCPASLTLILRTVPMPDPRRCTMDDVVEYFPSCVRHVPLQFFYAGMEYNAFIIKHTFTRERLSIRFGFDDGILNVCFKRLTRRHTIHDVLT